MREVKREREGVREVKTEGRPELNCSSCEAWLPGGKFNYRYVVEWWSGGGVEWWRGGGVERWRGGGAQQDNERSWRSGSLSPSH